MKLEDEPFDVDEPDEIPASAQPDEPDDEDKDEEEHASGSQHATTGGDYRKLATIVAVFAILLGFIISTYQNVQTGKPKVIYASRYSKEHKFRPAASPVVTETLKDGRVRIRGGEATMSSPPKPTTTPKRARKRTRSKQRTKRKTMVS